MESTINKQKKVNIELPALDPAFVMSLEVANDNPNIKEPAMVELKVKKKPKKKSSQKDESKTKDLREILLSEDNIFYYLKDGENRKGTFTFNRDGSLKFIVANGQDTWQILDNKRRKIEIRLNQKVFKFKFNREFTKGVLIDHVRFPPSLIIRESVVDDQ